jgi:hypothetical protein
VPGNNIFKTGVFISAGGKGSEVSIELLENLPRHDKFTSYRQVSPAPDLHMLPAHGRWPFRKLIIIGDPNCGLSFVVFGGRHVLRRKSVDS